MLTLGGQRIETKDFPLLDITLLPNKMLIRYCQKWKE